MNVNQSIENLKKRIKELEKENLILKNKTEVFYTNKPTVKVPKKIKPLFDKASLTVKKHFESFKANPSLAKIEVNGQRYILMRAESLANDFFKNIIKLYADRPLPEAVKIGRNLLFDMAHLIGIQDAKNFHDKMKLKDPISKLSAGPVHFAYMGWAFVDILKESKPSPDNNFFLKYNHPSSFEADSWIKSKEKANFPVCTMNAGYSSGWCEESFGINLTAVEITCRAKGDKNCTFIMAPPNKINEYLEKESIKYKRIRKYDVPLFFERKKIEEKLNNAVKEKETLLKEVHHRVKNNLQIITSLLRLHAEQENNIHFSELVAESQNRIISMSLIHEMLYATSNFSDINLSKYSTSIFNQLKSTYNKSLIKLKLSIPKDFSFEIDKMIPIGLILNEIISNSFKYAFPKNKGEISISFKNNSLTISDNGQGLPENFIKNEKESFGIQLIHLLADQIDAKLIINKTKGSSFTFVFKNSSKES
ncbi:MAG: histidine kinase dimerization/phosphoacceptor domain -containing protein [Bacteroidota bacterium]|nr:histidine kinase dimerization/phosphoacceptor domain -containing protein [Bacteroidota bacterium]MDP3145615.1 histidine kinase dimerization/phosphoacceptor domain -containing protein [Bacteroidota bacterium]